MTLDHQLTTFSLPQCRALERTSVCDISPILQCYISLTTVALFSSSSHQPSATGFYPPSTMKFASALLSAALLAQSASAHCELFQREVEYCS